MDVLRDGKTVKLTVTTKALPTDFGMAGNGKRPKADPADDDASFEAADMGVEVADLTAEQREELGVKSGVIITKADPAKPGHENGLRPGMVILKVGKKSIQNVEEFKAAMKDETLKDGILLYIHTRGGNNSFVVVKD